MPRKPLLTKEQVEEFYTHGQMTIEECCRQLGVSKPTFVRYMKLYNVEGRQVGGYDKETMGLYADRDEAIRKHRAAGWSYAKIGDKFRLSRQRVHAILSPKNRSTNVT